MEEDLLTKGINQFSIDWPQCSKNWFSPHWGSPDPETGEPVVGGTIGEAARRLCDIVDACVSGAFVPNREKDELTYAL